MARRALEEGAAGRGIISFRTLQNGRVAARCRFRDTDGSVRLVEAQGATEEEARTALTSKLNARKGPPLRKLKPVYGPDGEVLSGEFSTVVGRISADTTMRDAVLMWLTEVSTDPHRKMQTRDFWRQVARQTVLKDKGHVRVAEFDAGEIKRYLYKLAKTKPSQARHARLLIKAVLADAVIDKAIAHNPVFEFKAPKRPKRPQTRALSVEEYRELMTAIEEWRTANSGKGGAPRDGSHLLVDLMHVLAGTGLRINEALGLRLKDIDFVSSPPKLTVNGTLVQVTGLPVTFQPSTKGAAGDDRTIALPTTAARALARQIRLNGHPEYVFTTGTGNFVSSRNVCRSLRLARPASLAFFTPHTLRRSVATWLKNTNGLTAASQQLGHGSEDVTSEFYIAPEQRESIDNSAALNELLGDGESDANSEAES